MILHKSAKHMQQNVKFLFYYGFYGGIVALSNVKEKRRLLHILHFSWILWPPDSHMKEYCEKRKEDTAGRKIHFLAMYSW